MNPAIAWSGVDPCQHRHGDNAEVAADGAGEPAPSLEGACEFEALVRASQNGSSEAFARLVERHAPAVFNYLWRLTGNAHDSEDLTQETFLKAWRGIGRFQETRAFLPWLFVIARRTALNHFRAQRPVVEFVESRAEAGTAVEPGQAAERNDLADTIWRVARRLKPRQYEALWLHYAESLDAADMARIMGTSRIHVRVLLHRARHELRRLLDRSLCAADLPLRRVQPGNT